MSEEWTDEDCWRWKKHRGLDVSCDVVAFVTYLLYVIHVRFEVYITLARGINNKQVGLALRHVSDQFMSSSCFTVHRCINMRV